MEVVAPMLGVVMVGDMGDTDADGWWGQIHKMGQLLALYVVGM